MSASFSRSASVAPNVQLLGQSLRTYHHMRSLINRLFRTDIGLLILLASIFLALHVATSGPYGFHRDELATLDDARQLEWGFVAYPPLTQALGRLGLSLFGIYTLGVRLLPILAFSLALVC